MQNTERIVINITVTTNNDFTTIIKFNVKLNLSSYTIPPESNFNYFERGNFI